MSGDQARKHPGTLESLYLAAISWRTLSVVLLSFSSGMPLALVWIAIPDWMRSAGVDIRVVGLITLAQAPWTFKMLWSPFMDRYDPPVLDRRRGWAIVAQVGLFACTLALAGVGNHPDSPWVVAALAFALAFASASQDIAIDAYAVEVLRKKEQGMVVGARAAAYRGAMFIAGGLAITAAGRFGWPAVNTTLALLYLPMILITMKAPPPPRHEHAPRTLREAIWQPFLGFLARDRALEILAFVFLYKFADNLAQALLRPFLVDMGYTDFDRGIGLAFFAFSATIFGTFIGGFATSGLGLGHSLWAFGCIQIFSNLGYILVARFDMNPPLMYGAMTFESFTQGLGTGAFLVLLLRMTQKRFSATQYALFSSMFSIPRALTGPIAGFSVDALGWEPFFWLTMLAGIPGLFMLQRFSPIGVRDPQFTVRPPVHREPLSGTALARRAAGGGLVALAIGSVVSASMSALKAMRGEVATSFDLGGALTRLLRPETAGGWFGLLALLLLAIVSGLCVAAVSAARHGAARDLHDEDDSEEA